MTPEGPGHGRVAPGPSGVCREAVTGSGAGVLPPFEACPPFLLLPTFTEQAFTFDPFTHPLGVSGLLHVEDRDAESPGDDVDPPGAADAPADEVAVRVDEDHGHFVDHGFRFNEPLDEGPPLHPFHQVGEILFTDRVTGGARRLQPRF